MPGSRRRVVDPARFRRVLGALPTGVTVITSYGTGTAIGMTCNSFTSASLDPPLVALFPAKSSTTWPLIRESGAFCVNVMAEHHQGMTRLFASRGVDRFGSGEYDQRLCGPGIPDAIAWIDCQIVAEHDVGDHTIAVAEVVELDARDDATALVFWRGTYGPAPVDPGAETPGKPG